MSTYQELAELLVAEANTLLDELDERGEVLPSRERKLLRACGHMHRAAELVLELDPSDSLTAAVRALSDVCLCGHDRGDHGAEAPHVCEGTPFVQGVRASFDAVLTGDFGTCPCSGYAPARPMLATVPDFMTEPEPPTVAGVDP